ncbi:MAG: insulinase family protein [Candidatus Melainabacteria bacterium]|nr:MAG: insulinase family protein [Candidatus Melainabacteria bacterium]
MKLSLKAIRQRGFEKVAERDGIVEYVFKRNGLKVLHVENHSVPIVTTLIVYKIGSRNEAVGYTGSTHFLEHMMFKGTDKRNPQDGTGVTDILAPMGAAFNATTAMDRTNYFETAHRDNRRALLAMEADRMRNLRLRKDDRDSEMTVVRNELEKNDGNIMGIMYQNMWRNAFHMHPYHHPVIGWTSDIEGVPLERMKEFYDTYYWPNNATLIVVGDCTVDELLTDVRAEFGKISRSPKPIPEVYTSEEVQEGERRYVIERVHPSTPQVWLGHRIPEARHQDNAALNMLSGILGNAGDPNSRLYKALIETGKAVTCGASNPDMRDPGLFMLNATAAPGVDITEVEKILLLEVERIARDGVTEAEMAPHKAADRKRFILSRDSSKGFASYLCAGESVADWQWLLDSKDLFAAVTPEDVKAAAGHYFEARNRTVGVFNPLKKRIQKKPEAATPKRVGIKPATATISGATEKPKGTLASRVKRTVLPNGLTIVALAAPGTGTVSVSTSVKAGSAYAEYDKEIVPNAVGALLTMGSKNLSKEALAHRMDEMGSGIDFGVSQDMLSLAGTSTIVSTDLKDFLGVLAEVLLNPVFAESDLNMIKPMFGSSIHRSAADTDAQASAILSRELYEKGNPFYQKTTDELLAELPLMSVDDCKAFYAKHFSPKSTSITIAGDFDADKVLELIPDELKNWTGPDAVVLSINPATVKVIDKARRIDVPMPDKKSVSIIVGMPADISRFATDFYAARLANNALGFDTIGNRLGKVIRVKEGLTYGVNCSFGNPALAGAPWTLDLTVNPENVEKALGLIEDIVADYVASGVTEGKELNTEKGRAYGSVIVGMESTRGIAQTLSSFNLLGLPVSIIDDLKTKYDTVTKAEVDAAIRKYFDLSKAVTVVVGTKP